MPVTKAKTHGDRTDSTGTDTGTKLRTKHKNKKLTPYLIMAAYNGGKRAYNPKISDINHHVGLYPHSFQKYCRPDILMTNGLHHSRPQTEMKFCPLKSKNNEMSDRKKTNQNSA